MLLLTLFILTTVSLLVLGYVQLFTQAVTISQAHQTRIRAIAAARGGLADAAYEIKRLSGWPSGPSGGSLDPQWQSGGASTLYKSTQDPTHPLTEFDYPATISVSLLFGPDGYDGDIQATSRATILTNGQAAASTYTATFVRSLTGQVIVTQLEHD